MPQQPDSQAAVDGWYKGAPIDWSLVIPSITRPVHEPPALEVLDEFEEQGRFFRFAPLLSRLTNDDIDADIPDVAVRAQLLDMVCELVALAKYQDWVQRTRNDAKEVHDEERVSWYETLKDEVRKEIKAVARELHAFGRRHFPENSPLLSVSSEEESKQEGMAESSDSSSYFTAIDDSSGYGSDHASITAG